MVLGLESRGLEGKWRFDGDGNFAGQKTSAPRIKGIDKLLPYPV